MKLNPGTVIATPLPEATMDVLRKIVSLAVPASIALAAFLHAHAIGSLVDATMAPSSIAPFAEARASTKAAAATATNEKSANAILDRNPFDHVTGTLRPASARIDGVGDEVDPAFGDPLSAPACEGVRAVAAVHSANPDSSFAALNVGGRRTLQKRGGDIVDGEAVAHMEGRPRGVNDLRVVYVAEDRVWLSKGGRLCQAAVFGAAQQPPTMANAVAGGAGAPSQQSQSPLEKELASKIVKKGPNEFEIDRGAVNMILEAQTELMKTPLLPEKEGDRVLGFRLVKIKPGSVLSTLGLETGDRLVALNGIEVTSVERMMEAYAKLKVGTIDRLTIHIVRNGKPMNLDYVVR